MNDITTYRAEAVRLADDILVRGLRSGGSQYPNAECASDGASRLRQAIRTMPDGAEKAAFTTLADVFDRLWDEGSTETVLDALRQAVDAVLLSAPPFWQPEP
jgi:hypothetical protein